MTRYDDKYRDRPIADIVTGQIAVRGWTTGLDDRVTDEDPATQDDNETAATEAQDAEAEHG